MDVWFAVPDPPIATYPNNAGDQLAGGGDTSSHTHSPYTFQGVGRPHAGEQLAGDGASNNGLCAKPIVKDAADCKVAACGYCAQYEQEVQLCTDKLAFMESEVSGLDDSEKSEDEDGFADSQSVPSGVEASAQTNCQTDFVSCSCQTSDSGQASALENDEQWQPIIHFAISNSVAEICSIVHASGDRKAHMMALDIQYLLGEVAGIGLRQKVAASLARYDRAATQASKIRRVIG